VTINDAHCHFFSARFFEALGREQPGRFDPDPAISVPDVLGWDPPGPSEELADRWVAELDRQQVARATLIASTPGDEESVAAAVEKHPTRFVGFFMLDPRAPDAAARVEAALASGHLRGVCLFPAAHRYSLLDERVAAVVEAVARTPGAVVFTHCGVLSIGARHRLGLPSRFELRFGSPLDVQVLALNWPRVHFIIPHFGAGFLHEALMAAVMSRNIVLDTSSSNGWINYHPGLSLADVFRHAALSVGPERLIFGTDSSFFPRGWQRPILDAQIAAMESVGFAPPDIARVLGGNYDRLFPPAQ
jgi:predicted TIM-barrel fold metal-dependent hydrolase